MENSSQIATLPRKNTVIRDKVDGKDVLRVVGLPVFAEHEREHHGKTYRVDQEFLSGIANWMKAREDEGWRPAIHAEHNGPLSGPRPRLAFASNPRLGHAVLEGKPRTVLFVDALAESEEDLEELEKRVYRSPEVNLEKGTIESIAAMESEGPWFKFPISSFERAPGARLSYQMGTAGEEPGLVAAVTADPGSSYCALYRFPTTKYMQEAPMEGEEKMPMEEPEKYMGDYQAEEEEGGEESDDLNVVFAALRPMIEACIQNAMKKQKGGAEDMEYMGEKKPMEGMGDMLEGLEEQKDRPVALSKASTDADALRALEAKYAAKLGAMEAHYKAKLDGIATRLSAQELQTGKESAVAWARSETRGIVPPPDFEETIQKYAAQDPNINNAASPLAVYVKTLVQSAQPLPPSALPLDAPTLYGSEPTEIAQYVAEGGENATAARKASRLYSAMTPSLRNGKSLEEFIESYVARHGRNGTLKARA